MKQIIIRVWLNSGEKVGHASLQIGDFEGNNKTYGIGDNGIYVSIYPTGRGVKLFDRQGRAAKTKTLQEDNLKYNQKYGYPKKIKLYSLDESAMIEEYKKLAESGFNFSLLASSFLKSPETQNCSGLVLHLLKVGGIDSITSRFTILKFEMRQWAPSGIIVGAIAAPFMFYALSRIVPSMINTIKRIVYLNKVLGCIKPPAADELPVQNDTPFIIVTTLGTITFPSTIDPEELEKLIEEKFGNGINDTAQNLFSQAHAELTQEVLENKTITSLPSWMLYFVQYYGGDKLLIISIFISILAAGYIGAAGFGAVASFSITTPSDIAALAEEAERKELSSISISGLKM